MKSPADVLSQLIEDFDPLELSITGYTKFVSFLPNSPDAAICLYDTAGKPDGRVMRTGEQIEHPGVQIYLRHLSYPVGWAKLKEIADALSTVKNDFVLFDSDEVYVVNNISRAGTILALGIEDLGPNGSGDRRRHQFTVNLLVTLRKED